jgi:glycosyltransferase involved in cell wall biosynthesis
MKLSVGIITYNQQETIAQTLDSILCQQGDFELEVVIGEDCSTDNTWAICKEYAERYPEQVVLLENTSNLGIMANFARVMKACTGEYVGICAGDDYWCDEQKLQKQLNYFVAHPACGVCTTGGYRYLVRRDEMVPGIAPIQPIEDGDVSKHYFSESYQGGVYAMPLSMLFKRELLEHIDFNVFIERGFPVEDYPMQAIMAMHTRWGHIDDLTVVYRVYTESATFISYDHPKYMQYHRGLMEIRRYLRDKFALQLHNYSEDYILEYLFYREYLLYVFQGDYRKAKALASACKISTPKVKQAQKIASNWLVFILFRWYKAWRKDSDYKNRS